MNKGSIVERLCSDLNRKEPRYKSPTLLYFTLPQNDYHNFLPRDATQTRRAWYCYDKSSVCLSVRLSLTLRSRDRTCWKFSKTVLR